jgi:hypothetical protein
MRLQMRRLRRAVKDDLHIEFAPWCLTLYGGPALLGWSAWPTSWRGKRSSTSGLAAGSTSYSPPSGSVLPARRTVLT